MDGKIKPHVYDEQKNPIGNVDCKNGLYSRNSGTAIVEINSVYFLNKKFGVTYKLYQLVTYEPQTLKGSSSLFSHDEELINSLGFEEFLSLHTFGSIPCLILAILTAWDHFVRVISYNTFTFL